MDLAGVRVRILVVNAGSSSVKLTLVGNGEETLVDRELAAPHSSVDAGALRAVLRVGLGEADAVGHRIVHGGERFREPVRITPEVERALLELSELAPLHQAKSLATLDAVSAVLPNLPAVACFDTGFHSTLPEAAATYALPREWRERWRIRRYGFHGLSHAWVARRVPEVLKIQANGLRIVSCHLGAGASLCAIRNGASVDTTMGFTPLEGLVMATRSGSVDPGLVLWVLERAGMRADELAHALEHESGLLGLAGSADMREVLSQARAGDGPARLALEVYTHRLRGSIAAMAASLGGLDVLAFTGGVGERSPETRRMAASGLEFLGVSVDDARNRAASDGAVISEPGADVRTVVIRAREDLEIARQVRAVVEDSGRPA